MTFLLQLSLIHLCRTDLWLRGLNLPLRVSRWALSVALCLCLVLTGGGSANAAALDSMLSLRLSSGVFSSVSSGISGLGVAGGSAFHFSGSRPTTLGVSDGTLAPCPDSPNCVSSQAADEAHQIDAIGYGTSGVSASQVMQALKQIIDDSDRAEVLRAEDGYLYAEFTSRLMGFVDDVEFLFDPSDSKIEVRSASRLGESDLGVNRKRIELIRDRLQTLLNETGTAT